MVLNHSCQLLQLLAAVGPCMRVCQSWIGQVPKLQTAAVGAPLRLLVTGMKMDWSRPLLSRPRPEAGLMAGAVTVPAAYKER